MNSLLFCPSGHSLTLVAIDTQESDDSYAAARSRFLAENEKRCNDIAGDLWCCMKSHTVYDVYTTVRQTKDKWLQEFVTYDAAKSFADAWSSQHQQQASVVKNDELESWTGEMTSIQEKVIYSTADPSINVEQSQ